FPYTTLFRSTRLGMVTVGIVEQDPPDSRTLPHPGIDVEGLQVGCLFHIEPLFACRETDLGPLGDSRHGGIYQIIVVGQIIKINGYTFLGPAKGPKEEDNHKGRKAASHLTIGARDVMGYGCVIFMDSNK